MNLLNVAHVNNEAIAPPGSCFLTSRIALPLGELRQLAMQDHQALLQQWIVTQTEAMEGLGPVLARFYAQHPTGVTLHALPPRVEINTPQPGLVAYTLIVWAMPHVDVSFALVPPQTKDETTVPIRLMTSCGCESETIEVSAPPDEYIFKPTVNGTLRRFRFAGVNVFGTRIYRED